MTQQVKYPDKRIRMNQAEIQALLKILDYKLLQDQEKRMNISSEDRSVLEDLFKRLKYGQRGREGRRLKAGLKAMGYKFPCEAPKEEGNWRRMTWNERGKICVTCKYPCDHSKAHWVDQPTHLRS